MPGAPLERPIAPTLQGDMTVSGDAFSSGERGTLAFVVTLLRLPGGNTERLSYGGPGQDAVEPIVQRVRGIFF